MSIQRSPFKHSSMSIVMQDFLAGCQTRKPSRNLHPTIPSPGGELRRDGKSKSREGEGTGAGQGKFRDVRCRSRNLNMNRNMTKCRERSGSWSETVRHTKRSRISVKSRSRKSHRSKSNNMRWTGAKQDQYCSLGALEKEQEKTEKLELSRIYTENYFNII